MRVLTDKSMRVATTDSLTMKDFLTHAVRAYTLVDDEQRTVIRS